MVGAGRCSGRSCWSLHGPRLLAGLGALPSADQAGLDVRSVMMAAGDVGLPDIGDRVYQNMVYMYIYVLKSLVVTSSPSCKWIQKKNNVQSAAEVGEFNM